MTTPEPYVVEAVGEKRFTVAAVDLGIAAEAYAKVGIAVADAFIVRPETAPASCAASSRPDAVPRVLAVVATPLE